MTIHTMAVENGYLAVVKKDDGSIHPATYIYNIVLSTRYQAKKMAVALMADIKSKAFWNCKTH